MSTSTRPALETGWQPDTAIDDTVLRQGLFAMSACWEAVGQACGARVRRDDRFTAVDLGRPSGLFNSVTLLQPLLGADLDRALDEVEEFCGGRGTGETLLWSPWPTPDLTGRGWQLQGHPPMVLRPAQRPVQQRIPEHLCLEEVTSPGELADWCTVAVEGFPFHDVRAPEQLLDAAILGDERFRFVIGRADGRGVAAGCQFVEHGMDVLLLAVTRPEARGRGCYAALAADRIAHHPDLPEVAVVSDDSRPILVGRFDFLPLTRFALWARPRH